MKIFKKISAAFVAARAGFAHPELMFAPHFEVMSGLYKAVLGVQENTRPVMMRIGMIVPDGDDKAIATVWIGAGAGSSPEKRIEELVEENQILRAMISKITEKIAHIKIDEAD